MLRLYASSARGLGLILGWGLRSSMLYGTAEKKKKKKKKTMESLISVLFLMQSLLSLYLEQFGAYFAFECI